MAELSTRTILCTSIPIIFSERNYQQLEVNGVAHIFLPVEAIDTHKSIVEQVHINSA